MDSKIDPDTKEITLIYGGNEFDDKAEDLLRTKAKDLRLGDAKIIIEHGLKFNDLSKLESRTNEIASQQENEITRLRSALLMKQSSIDSMEVLPEMGESLLKEIKTIYPQIQSCSYAPTYMYVDSIEKSRLTNIVYFTSSDTLSIHDKNKIKRWLKSRLDYWNVVVKF